MKYQTLHFEYHSVLSRFYFEYHMDFDECLGVSFTLIYILILTFRFKFYNNITVQHALHFDCHSEINV